MIGTGWTGRTSQLAAVVFSLLITGVRADSDAHGYIALGVIIIIIKLIWFGYKVKMRYVDSQDSFFLNILDSNVDDVSQTSFSALVSDSHTVVKRARHRLATQVQQQTSAVVASSLPAGRYRGSRSFSDSSDREAVEYTLHFSSDGSVEGTMKTGNTGTKFRVVGEYDPEKQELKWIESNVRSFEGTTYDNKLMEISAPDYYGSERLTEALVRVIETDTVSLVGEFTSSSGATGDFRLIHSPNTDGSKSFNSQPGEVSVSTATPLLQKSTSFESRMSVLETTLEKESM